MAVPTSSPVANYTQPSTSNSASRNRIHILASGDVVVEVYRADATGKLLEIVNITVPANGGPATDEQGRVYANVLAGSAFENAVETIVTQADGAVASFAGTGKFNR